MAVIHPIAKASAHHHEVGEVFNRTPSAISYWSNKLSDLVHIGDEEAMRYIDYIKP